MAETFGCVYKKYNGGAAIGTDAAPNTADPTSTFRSPSPDGNGRGGGGSQLALVSVGASSTVTVWVKDPGSSVPTNKWVPVKTGLTVTATDFAYVAVPSAATVFVQVTASTATELLGYWP